MSGNIFASKKGAKGDKVEDDFLGGGGVVDTDIYEAKIKYAYIGKAQNSDARNVTLSLDVNGREVRETIWVTNRNGDVTYQDKRTKEDRNLPGYNLVNSLCMLVASKELGQMDVEEKTLNLYDFEARQEKPRAVDCFVELHGETVHVAIQRQTVDKEKKDDNGEYHATGETRDINEIQKFFPAEKLVTISEVANFISSLGGDFEDVLTEGDLNKAIDKMDDDQGIFAKAWLEKHRGKTYNKSKGASAEGKAFGGGSGGGSSEKKKTSSLFDD